MANMIDVNIMTTLLKSIYNQNLISEDVYNHSLNNLSKTLDCGHSFVYDVSTNAPLGQSARKGDLNGYTPS